MAFLFEVIGLQTARGRLLCIGLITLAVFAAPYSWLAQLSLWDRLGWHSAPSIGLTRAYWLLLHGHVQAAWHRNWLIFPVLAIVLLILVRDSWVLGSRHRLGGQFFRKPQN
jgi:hypothetical protein